MPANAGRCAASPPHVAGSMVRDVPGQALKLTYNRTRQAAITTEILEIVGGAEALAAG